MRYIFILSLILTLWVSCKKDKSVTPDPDPGDTTKTEQPSATTLQLIADSVFLLSKEIYYWKDTIGAVSYAAFNPRQYIGADELTTAKAVLAAVRNYNHWDKTKQFSFAETYVDATSSSKAATAENGYGFDLKDAWKNRSVNPTYRQSDFQGWYVSYVYPDSDAGKKGVKRGMKLAKVNGTLLTYTQSSVDIINNMFYYETLKTVDAQFVQANGDTLKVSVGSGSFKPNSVITTAVLTTHNGNKAGYIVYNFFDRLNDSRAELDAALQSLKDQSVSSIILDLRYNRGGYTSTQDYLTNRIAPASTAGVMYRYYYNSNLSTGNYTALKSRYPNYLSFTTNYNTINFSTANSINPVKLYVIVGDETASSSELLINNLKPVFGNNLILIGDRNTYGKPVGFFPIDLFKKVTFWTVSFMTRNRNNDSVAYTGFQPQYRVYDGVDKAWSDTSEECTAAALALIDGRLPAVSAATQTQVRSIVTPRLDVKRKERSLDNMLFTKD